MSSELPEPRVSVIIPTYNRAHLLPRAVQSVLSQTFTEFELIIVDDASTDNTKSVVNSFHDARIRYVRLETSHGGAGARNAGIREAKGEFIAFLDDDDEWLAQKLEKQVAVLERVTNDDVGVVVCGSRVFRAGGYRESIPRPSGWIYEQKLAFRYAATTSTFLVRKCCFDRIGEFDETFPSFEEWDLLLRLSKEFRIEHVDEVLHIYYEHEGARLSDTANQIRAMQIILRKYARELQMRPQIKAKHTSKLARMHMRIGQFPEAREQIAAALRASPLNIKHWLLYMMAAMGSGVFQNSYSIYVMLSRFKRSLARRTGE